MEGESMLFKRIYDEDLAQASYFIGCQAEGTAVVVDPRRDVGVYLDEAKRHDMKIIAVTETHIHADYLSGSRELAHATGATLYLSDEGDADWKYGFGGVKLYDGSEIRLGNITLTAVHTPGHTPEHMSFLVTDGASATVPGFILTGDFVFVGDLGRPDLLDEAAGGKDTRFAGAKQLFRSLKDAFLALPDYVQVWPGHGAGSACGKALGAVPSSTVGYERLVGWWVNYLEKGDEEGFVKALLEGQPDAPAYFGRMKCHNKAGPALLGELPALEPYRAGDIGAKLGGNYLLIDTRAREVSERDAISGALHIPAGKTFATYASYVIDPERDERPIVLLAGEQAEALRDKLIGIGVDRVVGYVTSLNGFERRPVPTIAPERLAGLDHPFILDVRTRSEFEAGHIPGATHIPAGRVAWRLAELPKDRPIVTHCQSGARSSVVASTLRAAGFHDVLQLEGSFEDWQRTECVGA
jgi:hydroxyacylglutathione hydrolase